MERVALAGPVGKLEGLLDVPEEAPRVAALLCHPLPTGGGTMHTHAVVRAMRALRSRGVAVLRFNFRGVGASAGSFDEGRGEQEDARAALIELRRRYPDLPFLCGGFSFGSFIGMQVGVREKASGLLGLGIPSQRYDFQGIEVSEQPKGFVHAENDEFTPLALFEQAVAQMKGPVRVWVVPKTSHLFTEDLDAYQAAVGEAVDFLISKIME